MIKIIFLVLAYVSLNVAVPLNRTNYIDWVHLRNSKAGRGMRVTERDGGFEILWREKIDFDTNPVKVYFNYIFEDSGNREIIYVDNLCGTYPTNSLERDVQLHILTKFANTDECPIAKGTKVFFKVPDAYTFPTENRECGPVDGAVYVSKLRDVRAGHTPLFLRFHFTGYVTGAECST